MCCAKCKAEFEHSQTSDVGMAFLAGPEKPLLASSGNSCVCPSCGNNALYKRENLFFVSQMKRPLEPASSLLNNLIFSLLLLNL
jgi:DNA-directed RNA polymerase subunit RPC12/RpoP